MSNDNDVFVARQPILDRQHNVVAYELLFRDDGSGEARISDGARATAQVISRVFGRLGVRSVIGGSAGFINVDTETLLGRKIERLPTQGVVLELLETVEIDDEIVHRCAELKHLGYRLALDDFCAIAEAYEPLLELVDIVKIDVLQLDPAALERLVRRLRLYPAQLLAEKVDTLERARQCLALGFDLYQGFHFGRPAALAGI
jgi:EAL and modified HD-GYP domain-containing signal transduction protein